MRTKPPAWVDPLMRAGYTARGVVYSMVGVLAVLAAVTGGQAPDSRDALGAILVQPFGRILLGILAAGLFGYCTWRFIDAAFDLDDKGTGPKGWLARGAQAGSGLAHLFLAISAGSLSWHEHSVGENIAVNWSAALMSGPLGQWLVGAFGIIVIGFGIQHFVAAYKEKYKDSMRYTALAAKLDPVVKFGLLAHGVVVCIVGVFFIWAAWTAQASHAGGLGDALNTVRTATFGRTLLGIVAAGLISFAVHCFIEAAYRVVPRCRPQNLETLASKARSLRKDADQAIDATRSRIERGIRSMSRS